MVFYFLNNKMNNTKTYNNSYNYYRVINITISIVYYYYYSIIQYDIKSGIKRAQRASECWILYKWRYHMASECGILYK